jgi:hypothetical protein
MMTLLMLLAGCAATYQPIPEGYTGERVSIADSFTHKTASQAHYFILEKVNGNKVKDSWGKTRMDNYGRGMIFTPSIVSRDILPVKQTLTVKGLVFFPTDAQALFGDNMAVTKEITFVPVVGEIYKVNGKLGDAPDVWIEDSSGQRVANDN